MPNTGFLTKKCVVYVEVIVGQCACLTLLVPPEWFFNMLFDIWTRTVAFRSRNQASVLRSLRFLLKDQVMQIYLKFMRPETVNISCLLSNHT